MTNSRTYLQDLGGGRYRVLGLLLDPWTGRYITDEDELEEAWRVMREAAAEAEAPGPPG
ncbi:hypothetical protein [Mycetocola saprophilus]|uniref:hypothetical protein n=1 Tax=Mycetocola saprophilus TaxID=76636 RepID=UPI003BF434DF